MAQVASHGYDTYGAGGTTSTYRCEPRCAMSPIRSRRSTKLCALRHKETARRGAFARPRRRGTLSTGKNPSVIRQRFGGTEMPP